MTSDAGARWRTYGAIVASGAVGAFAYGLTTPLLSLSLEARGESATTTGLLAATGSFAIIALAPLVPAVARAMGVLAALFLGLGCVFAALIVFASTESLWIWFPMRVLAGIGIGLHWILSETWLNAVTEERVRGRAIAAYMTLVACGFGSGSVLIAAVGAEGPALFHAGAVLVALSGVPLWLARRAIPPAPARAPAAVRATFTRFPLLMLAATLGGINDMSMIALMPVYGVRTGLVPEHAALLLSVYMAGTIALQWPMGWLADHMDRRRVLLGAAAATAVLAALYPFTKGTWALWPVLFVWGGCALALYTVSLALVASRTEAGRLAAANAAFVMLYEMGSLSGPTITGAAMDAFGPTGLPWTLAALSGTFVVVGVLVRQGWGEVLLREPPARR